MRTHKCKNCDTSHKKKYEIGQVDNTWTNETIHYCSSCANQQYMKLKEKYIIDEVFGIDICKVGNKYYVGLFSDLYMNSLAEARLVAMLLMMNCHK